MLAEAKTATTHAYDLDNDGQADYIQTLTVTDGHVTELRFLGGPANHAGHVVRLDDVPNGEVPHVVIALDGVPFELVEQLYRQGRFRLFYPPSRLISTFPAVTDVMYSRIFGTRRCLGFQAEFYDRQAGRLAGGSSLYFSGGNARWLPRLDYRCSMLLDPYVYTIPNVIFAHELRGMDATVDKLTKAETYMYSVATAGLGTRGGRDAILQYLVTIDRFCQQIVHERHGRVKLTLLADHGHNMVPARRASLRACLAEAGFTAAKRIGNANDVVLIEYGLVTYAAIYTDRPEAVTDAVLTHPAVDVVAYLADDHVVVRSAIGRAAIFRADGGYRYDASGGDPLRLAPILAQLTQDGTVSPDGVIDDRALFHATAQHDYPDPLHRLWQAFHGLVDHPPDVLVSLRDGYTHGSKMFDWALGGVASTHGALSRMNSNTAVLSMLGPLPAILRPEDVLPALKALRTGDPVDK